MSPLSERLTGFSDMLLSPSDRDSDKPQFSPEQSAKIMQLAEHIPYPETLPAVQFDVDKWVAENQDKILSIGNKPSTRFDAKGLNDITIIHEAFRMQGYIVSKINEDNDNGYSGRRGWYIHVELPNHLKRSQG